MLTLEDVTAATARRCAEVRPAAGQQRFVATVGRYLRMCDEGDTWQPLAIFEDAEVVGFCMWAADDDGGRRIGGLVIDAPHQGRGLGGAAMEALLDRLGPEAGAAGVALSYHPENEAARHLYASLGFHETGETDGSGEVVARWVD